MFRHFPLYYLQSEMDCEGLFSGSAKCQSLPISCFAFTHHSCRCVKYPLTLKMSLNSYLSWIKSPCMLLSGLVAPYWRLSNSAAISEQLSLVSNR